jgi:hypothetical protein
MPVCVYTEIIPALYCALLCYQVAIIIIDKNVMLAYIRN